MHVLARLRRRVDLRREDGLALVLALAIIVVLSITTATAVSMVNSTSSTAGLSTANQTALELAEAGINSAEAALNATNANASSPTLLGCSASIINVNNSANPCTPITLTLAAGTASYYGLYTQGASTGTWSITSTGTVPSMTGGGNPVKRTLTATATITGGGQSNNISIWNYMYSTAPSDGNPGTCEVTFNADHDTITTPLYVTGDLCMYADHSTIRQDTSNGGQAVDVRVGGGITLSGAHATIGCGSTLLGTCTSVGNITSGYSGLGCRTTTTGTYHPCTTADHWYVNQTDAPITATPPTVSFSTWYANASPGPNHVCDSTLSGANNLMTTQPHAFDNDTTMNGTNTIFNLTPTGSDYSCVTSSGTLSWNHTTKLLTIAGTIFFDGNVEFQTSNASYSGQATIYANGEVFFNASGNAGGIAANCPVSGVPAECGFGNGTWNVNQNMMLLVANKASGTAIDMSVDHSLYQGDLYCPPTSSATIAGDHTEVEGGIICGNFTFGDHSQIFPLPTITNLPPGAPVPPNAAATVSAPTYNG